MSQYDDGRIACTDDEICIRGYYFPIFRWGAKHIPYAKLRKVRRVRLGTMRGRGRIWGTANPRYWANFDAGRPGKQFGFVLDVGRFVRPFITPDDPDAAASAIGVHSAITIVDNGAPAPFI